MRVWLLLAFLVCLQKSMSLLNSRFKGLFVRVGLGKASNPKVAIQMALYDGDEVTRSMILQSEMIFVAPIEAIRMDEVQWVRKNLPKDAKTSVVSRQSLIQGIDGTPFVQMVDGVIGSSFVVFVNNESEKAYSVFSKWTRDLASRIAEDMQKNPNVHISQVSFYLAYKDGHCIRVPIPPSDGEFLYFGGDHSIVMNDDTDGDNK